MNNELSGIDHLVFSTRDIQLAYDRLVSLGFTLTPRGYHTRLGTMNHTAMFKRGNYIELLGIAQSTPANQMFERPLAEHAEALSVIVPKVSSPEALYQRFRNTRFEAQAPVSFSRTVKTVGGDKEARFTIVAFGSNALPLASSFACQHHTPELVWLPDYLSHRNGVVGISHIRYELDNPDEAAAIYGELFGVTLTERPGGKRLGIGEISLEFISHAFAAAKSGSETSSSPAVAIGFKSEDISALHRVLEQNDVPYAVRSGATIVSAPHAAGAAFEFVQ